jgi:hypothetical protein
MHHALEIPELQLMIIEQVAFFDEEVIRKRGKLRTRPFSRSNLLALALTCKTFFPVVLPTLWSTAPSLTSLIRTFPADLWSVIIVDEHGEEHYSDFEDDEDSSDWDDTSWKTRDEQLVGLILPLRAVLIDQVFERSLCEKDWERFDMYASHVRALVVSRPGEFMRFNEFSATTEIAPSVLAEMGRFKSPGSWIPRLENLYIEGNQQDLLLARHMFTDNLKILTIGPIVTPGRSLEDSYPFDNDGFIYVAITNFLESAALLAPKIHTLEINSGYVSAAHGRHLTALMKTRSFKSLQIKSSLCGNIFLLNSMAASPITRLGISIGHCCLQNWKHTKICLEVQMFPNLTHFEPSTPDLSYISQFLSFVEAPKLKTLKIDIWGTPTTAKQFTEFVDALIITCDVSNLRKFSLVIDKPVSQIASSKEEHDQMKAALFKLTRASNISELVLKYIPHALLDRMKRPFLDELAEALPNAERIMLHGLKERPENSRKKFIITLRDVEEFSSKLHKLRELGLSGVDGTHIPRPHKSLTAPRVSDLHLFDSNVSKVTPFVNYMKKYFPRLEVIDCGEHPWRMSKWREARNLLMDKRLLHHFEKCTH